MAAVAVAPPTAAMAAAKISDEPAAPASKSSHLAKQDLATMDPSKLNPRSPEVISRQATINIGELLPPPVQRSLRNNRRLPNPLLLPSDSTPLALCCCDPRPQRSSSLPEAQRAHASGPLCAGTIGHVAHGKSTVVKAISGVHVRRSHVAPLAC